MQRIENGTNGRGALGRFAKGNPGGPGNPFASMVNKLRREALAAVNADELRALIRKLYEQAIGGDVNAARVLLDRLLGKPVDVGDDVKPERLVINVGIRERTPDECEEIRRETSAKFIEQDLMEN